jgi:hypothetical protein
LLFFFIQKHRPLKGAVKHYLEVTGIRQNTKFAAIVISFFLVILFGFGYQNASAQTTQKFVLKYSTADIEASGGQKNAVIPALKRIEQRSNGKITFQMNFAGGLLKAAEEYEGLINGVADFGSTMLYTQSNLYQIASLGMLPYAGKDPVNIYKAITCVRSTGLGERFQGSWPSMIRAQSSAFPVTLPTTWSANSALPDCLEKHSASGRTN